MISCHIYSLSIANSIYTNENYFSIGSNKGVTRESHELQHELPFLRVMVPIDGLIARLKIEYIFIHFFLCPP